MRLVYSRQWSYKSGFLRCCKKGYPFQGPKLGPCLTLGNELSKETQVLTKQEILLGKGTPAESRRGREPRRTALLNGLQSRVYGDGISFQAVLSQSFWLKSPSWWCSLVQPRWMPERNPGGWLNSWCFLLIFPELFWLVKAYQFPVPWQDLLS